MENGNTDPCLVMKTTDVSNPSKHLKTAKHAAAIAQRKQDGAEAARALTPGLRGADARPQRLLPFVAKPRTAEDAAAALRRNRVVQPFTLVQRQRTLVAALLLASYSTFFMQAIAMRSALVMVSGLNFTPSLTSEAGTYAASFTPPARDTVRAMELSFEKQFHKNLERDLIASSLLGPDGLARPSAAPLASISFDGSSTKVDGWSSISLNLNWLDPVSALPKHANLGVSKFQLSNSAEALAGTGVNLATWVCAKLKEFGLIPRDHAALDVSRFIRAATTDNASPEVNAVVKQLNIFHQPCICHTLELIIKASVDPPISESAKKNWAEACAAATQAGDMMPPNPRAKLGVIVDVLVAMAKFFKKSGKGREFLAGQESKGVVVPLKLISRSQTRWSIVYDMLCRLITLRFCMSLGFTLTQREAFSGNRWGVVMQSIVFLKLFKDAIVACQSRKQLIGAHIVHVYSVINGVFHPETLGMLPTDFEASVININTKGWSPARFLERGEGLVRAAQHHLLPDVKAMVQRMKDDIASRLTGKMQLNGLTTAMAVAFDPGLKDLILDETTPNDLLTAQFKAVVVAKLMRNGRDLEAEMGLGSTATDDADEDEPVAKTARATLVAALRAASGRSTVRSAPREADSAFASEMTRWRARPVEDVDGSEFWSSEYAKRTFPILRRLFLSCCSMRPDNAEPERDFSAMTRLLSPLRRGKMSASTVARKLTLSLNKQYWTPNPELDDDVYWKEVLRATGAAAWAERAPPSDSESSDDGGA